ncbi:MULTISPECIES: ROK family protein [unclassified Brevundimonas]|uniref:ROK family protein n=1 Tax=unclassified Brevundimonas TaxID=2622653 RepID=UPI000E81499D|nr:MULTISPECIES: ROK family protein [unclassified Brevundimonas]MCK6102836.1 ROK family protein [Brevundimonas sp. EYE_349]HBI18259.1 transcriptional regulator [Brevundimonas sp.]
MTQTLLLGGVEAGGTKFVCGVADGDGRILEQVRIATTTPSETLAAVDAFFARAAAVHGHLAALGVCSFGPLSLRLDAPDYGAITTTPKPGWSGANLLSHLRRAANTPTVLTTDVNGSAIGERLFGSGRGLDSFCYVTVGTGVGVGVIIDGRPHGGANHPEAGHIRTPRAAGDTAFAGACPFHGDCLEGLASGPAMRMRWGAPAETLPIDHPAWLMAAHYVASLCANLTYVIRPQRIIIGGGVMQPHLYDRVRRALVQQLGGYDASVRELVMDDYIAAPSAGASAGLYGALALAYREATGDWPTGWMI